MFITQCYKYEKDGIVYVGGNVPEDATILEIMDILNAEEGFDLIRIADNENMGSSVWLKGGDVQENYKVVKSETVETRQNYGTINNIK